MAEEVAEATEDTETDAAVPEGPEADEAAESADDTPAEESEETDAVEKTDEADVVSEAKSEEAHAAVESEASSSGSAEEASEAEADCTEETLEAAETEEVAEEVAEATEDTETDAAVPEGPEADEAAESADDTPAEESEETETEEKAVGEPEDPETETSAEIITLAERQRTADDAESEAEDFDDAEADEWDDDAAEDVAEELPSEEAPDADAAEDAASEEPEAEVIILQADSEESVRKHRKLPYIAAGLAVLLIVAAAIAWYFMPSSRETRTLRKAEAAYAASDYADAAALYRELMNYGGQTAEVCLHAADAYANAGHHAEAVALLGHALASDPDNTALQALLEDLNPTVEFSPEGGDFTDPVSVTMTADDHDIRYTLRRDSDSDAAAEITYATPAELRYSGSYTLTARGIGRDGEAGDAFTQQYVVKLDPEKYHLNDWMETEQGVQYLDETGRCVTGWQTIDGKKYYFDSDGYRVTGMTEIDRDTYFFDADGVMQTGWQQDGTDWYFFDETGKLQRDVWIEETFYVDADGRMLTNATTPDGVKVGADGRRASDLATVFSEYPDAMVVIYSKERKNEGDYSTFSGKLYHQHSSDKPEGDSTDITVRVSNKAWVHYLDRTSLPDVLVTDAYQFLPYLGILNPTIDENGVITAFDFILGSQG